MATHSYTSQGAECRKPKDSHPRGGVGTISKQNTVDGDGHALERLYFYTPASSMRPDVQVYWRDLLQPESERAA